MNIIKILLLIILIIFLLFLIFLIYLILISKNRYNKDLYIINKIPKIPNITKKYAICIWGEPRGIKSTINNFYKYLVDPLKADLFIITQKTNKDIDNNIFLFKKNIIINKPYEKYKNIKDILKIIDKLDSTKNNYIINSSLQIYLNMYHIYKNYSEILEKNYEYIILTRTDFLHLFEFPDIIKLTNNNNIFWCYDGHEWGGINACLIAVPNKYIKKYLYSMFEMLNDNNNIKVFNSLDLNIEKFLKIIFDKNKWEVGKIQNNAFLSADSNNELTTWAKVEYDKELKKYYKYIDQLNNVKHSLKEYNNNKKWKYIIKDGIKNIILQ